MFQGEEHLHTPHTPAEDRRPCLMITWNREAPELTTQDPDPKERWKWRAPLEIKGITWVSTNQTLSPPASGSSYFLPAQILRDPGHLTYSPQARTKRVILQGCHGPGERAVDNGIWEYPSETTKSLPNPNEIIRFFSWEATLVCTRLPRWCLIGS